MPRSHSYKIRYESGRKSALVTFTRIRVVSVRARSYAGRILTVEVIMVGRFLSKIMPHF